MGEVAEMGLSGGGCVCVCKQVREKVELGCFLCEPSQGWQASG